MNCKVPTNLIELDDLLKKSKSHVFSPFFCAGKDNKTLFALISCFVESFGGKKSYEKLVEIFQTMIDVAIEEEKKGNIEKAPIRLVNLANENGGLDNITVVVIKNI